VSAAGPELTQLCAAGGLQVDWHDPQVLIVTLDRPQTRNAQTPATWRALAALGAALPDATRVVVLRGNGPSFSSGLDRRMFSPEGVPGEPGLAAIAAMTPAAADAVIAQFQQAFTWWHDLDVVTVAVVQGAAVGAGFQLALACDLIVCADDARFAMKETSLGLVPDLGGTHPLVRAVGYRRALQLCLTGGWIDAAQALEMGLATAVAPLGRQDAAATELVADLLAAPAGAVAATRRLLRDAVDRPVDAQRAAEREEQRSRLRALVG
jgi:enoyl-CoA hydratase/carnithine racemase